MPQLIHLWHKSMPKTSCPISQALDFPSLLPQTDNVAVTNKYSTPRSPTLPMILLLTYNSLLLKCLRNMHISYYYQQKPLSFSHHFTISPFHLQCLPYTVLPKNHRFRGGRLHYLFTSLKSCFSPTPPTSSSLPTLFP